jgi:hypothetical protein
MIAAVAWSRDITNHVTFEVVTDCCLIACDAVKDRRKLFTSLRNPLPPSSRWADWH